MPKHHELLSGKEAGPTHPGRVPAGLKRKPPGHEPSAPREGQRTSTERGQRLGQAKQGKGGPLRRSFSRTTLSAWKSPEVETSAQAAVIRRKIPRATWDIVSLLQQLLRES